MKIVLLLLIIFSINSFAQSKGSEKEIKEYYINILKGEKDPYIDFVRDILDKYYTDILISNNEISDDVIKEFQQLDKAYSLSRFVLLNIQDFILGGKILTIIFIDKPNKIFDVAIKSVGDTHTVGDTPSFLFSFSEHKENKKKLLDFYKKNKLAQYSRFAY